MSRCKHNDCFTCPYSDCVASTRGIHSIPRPKTYDGQKGKYNPKQAPSIHFTHKGLRENKYD